MVPAIGPTTPCSMQLALHVLGYRPLGHAKRSTDAFVAQIRLELQAEHILDLAHGFPLGWHPSSEKIGEDNPPQLKSSADPRNNSGS